MRIVIVDDDPLVASSLKMILEAGGEVEAAAVDSDGRDPAARDLKTRHDMQFPHLLYSNAANQ